MTNKEAEIESLKEDPEFGLDSRYQSMTESENEAAALMEARLRKMRNMSGQQILHAKLIALKLQMEAYLKQPSNDKGKYFSDFLERYIDAIYPKRIQFAADVDISPVQLSQVLNNHRGPNDDFIKRLMVHSEKVFSGIGLFDSKIWYQIYLQDKLTETFTSQDDWRSALEKHIKYSKQV